LIRNVDVKDRDDMLDALVDARGSKRGDEGDKSASYPND